MMKKLNIFIHMLIAVVFTLGGSRGFANDHVGRTGDYLQYSLPVIAYGLSYGKKDIQGEFEFMKSFATTVAVTHGLKYAVPKARPNGNDTKSFVSGHTSASFASAAFIQKRYGWRYGVPAYLAASYVGWSRVHTKQHDTSDVLRGALLGIFASYQFSNRKIRIEPNTDGETTGIEIKIEW